MTERFTTRELLEALAKRGYTKIPPEILTISDVLELYEEREPWELTIKRHLARQSKLMVGAELFSLVTIS